MAKGRKRENRSVGSTLRKIQGYLERSYYHERCVQAVKISVDTVQEWLKESMSAAN